MYFFTKDNEKFISFWNHYPNLYKGFDWLLNLSAAIIELITRLAIIISELFSLSSSNYKEIQVQKEEANACIDKFKKYLLQVRCILLVGVIVILSIPLLMYLGERFGYYYSQVMSEIVSLISFIFAFTNIEIKPYK